MTKLSPRALILVEEVRKRWVNMKIEQASAEALIRQTVAAEFAMRLHNVQLEVAESIRVALAGGATKVALRNVTSKNPGTLERMLGLVNPGDPDLGGGAVLQ